MQLVPNSLLSTDMHPTVNAAMIAAVISVVVFTLGVRQQALERKRKSCAEALADALSWLEIPYRIRRRPNDSPETLQALANHVHQLQERLLFHQSWLRLELPGVYESYHDLVREVRTAARSPIQDAWVANPIGSAVEMNVGDLGLAPSDEYLTNFATRVRDQLAWWKVLH